MESCKAVDSRILQPICKPISFIFLLSLTTLNAGCFHPASTEQGVIDSVTVEENILRVRLLPSYASFLYLARVDVTRSGSVIRIAPYFRTLHKDPDQNIEIPEVAILLYPDDQELRCVTGQSEETIWVREDHSLSRRANEGSPNPGRSGGKKRGFPPRKAPPPSSHPDCRLAALTSD